MRTSISKLRRGMHKAALIEENAEAMQRAKDLLVKAQREQKELEALEQQSFEEYEEDLKRAAGHAKRMPAFKELQYAEFRLRDDPRAGEACALLVERKRLNDLLSDTFEKLTNNRIELARELPKLPAGTLERIFK